MPPKPKLKPMTTSNTTIFSPGTAVEVSSDEPGFRGSFYLGTIIEQRASDSYLVEYKTLVTESSKGSRPLREVVSFTQLRPAPLPETKWVFRMGDEVDVYHNDGWWEAVVTKVVGDGRFEVFFSAYKEQMEFAKEDLRLHRKWVSGIWVPEFEEDQEDAQMRRSMSHGLQKTELGKEINCGEETRQEKFEKGTVVEVSSDEDGFQGAWFAATIVEPVGKDKFLVEYHNLRTDDDRDFLREEIDTLHIRPSPPKNLMVGRFNLLEEVDSFYNDGWWVGVISKVLSGSKYIVYFRGTNEKLEFHHSELRLHQEWISGKWVMASQALKL